jgi:hypothetical protein
VTGSIFGAVLVLCGAGCAAQGRAPASPERACAACEELDRPPEASLSEPERYQEARAPTRVFRDGPSDRWAVRQIGPPAAAQTAARPKRTKKVDIDLVRAPFDETARLLSDSGRFNVVVEAPSATPVTVHLKAIEPYDALVILAEARGLSVSYRRGVVVVTGAKPGARVD